MLSGSSVRLPNILGSRPGFCFTLIEFRGFLSVENCPETKLKKNICKIKCMLCFDIGWGNDHTYRYDIGFSRSESQKDIICQLTNVVIDRPRSAQETFVMYAYS